MNTNNTQLAILAGTVIALGAIVLVAVLFGTEVAAVRVIQYLSSAAPALLGYVFLANKQGNAEKNSADTQEKVTYLAGTLNGKLDKRFADLETRIASHVENASSSVKVVPSTTGEITVVTNAKDKTDDA